MLQFQPKQRKESDEIILGLETQATEGGAERGRFTECSRVDGAYFRAVRWCLHAVMNQPLRKEPNGQQNIELVKKEESHAQKKGAKAND